MNASIGVATALRQNRAALLTVNAPTEASADTGVVIDTSCMSGLCGTGKLRAGSPIIAILP